MARDYTVQQGDHLTKIAEQFGFRTLAPIWDHPKNAPLRELRGNPHVLLPGDIVHVPDHVDGLVARPAGQSHTFKLRGMELLVRVVVLDHRFRPTANLPCELDIAGPADAERTDEGGVIAKLIPKAAEAGTLRVGDDVLQLQIGHLDPVDAVSGARARLNALGYDAGDSDDTASPQFRSAVEELQCDLGFGVVGDLDALTLAKLVELHGC